MKNLIVLSNLYLFTLLIACAEAPVYEPKPKDSTITANGNQPDKAATGNKDQVANNTQTPAAADKPADAAVKPAPTPTPTPAATAPNPALGVVATGKTVMMQSCVGTCHVNAATNDIKGKTEDAVAAASTIPAHSALVATHFTKAAATAPANNLRHISAYLSSIATPVVGPLP